MPKKKKSKKKKTKKTKKKKSSKKRRKIKRASKTKRSTAKRSKKKNIDKTSSNDQVIKTKPVLPMAAQSQFGISMASSVATQIPIFATA